MTNDDQILFTQDDGIAEIRINRPNKMNAMDRAMYARITDLIREIDVRDDIRVGIITGSGERAFSAGADLVLYHGHDDQPESWGPWRPDQWDFGVTSGKPLIAAVNGYALAGGLELALLCDIRIASDNAQFGAVEVKWGLLGSMNTYLLSRTVGSALAMEMLLTGRSIDAQEALAFGLVSRVVESTELLPAAYALARAIREHPAGSVAMIKELASRGRNLSFEDHLRLAKAYYALADSSPEQQAGIQSFRSRGVATDDSSRAM